MVGPVVLGHLLGPLELDAVALAVVEGEGDDGRARMVLLGGQREAHGRVEPAGQDDDVAQRVTST